MCNLEMELGNLPMKDLGIIASTTIFNDLATLCLGLVTPKYKKIEQYIWGMAQ